MTRTSVSATKNVGSNARAVLDACTTLVHQRDLSTPLAATSLDRLASHAGMSIAAVRRSLRSKARLDEHVTVSLVQQHLNWQRAARIWTASQHGQAAGDVRGAIEFGFEGSRKLLLERDVITGLEAIGLSPNHLGWPQRAQVVRMVINPVAVSRTTTLQLMGLRPRSPFGVRDLCSDVFACGLGVLAMSAAAGTSDTALVASAAGALERFFLGALEPGALGDFVPVQDEEDLEAPRLSLAERHLLDSSLADLTDAGLPHPFHHLGVRALAAAAHVSTGTIYSHYDSLDAFRATLLDHVFLRRRTALHHIRSDGSNLGSALAQWAGTTIDYALLFRCAGSADPALRQAADKHLQASVELLCEALDAGHEHPSEPDSAARATMLLTYALGAIGIHAFQYEPEGRTGASAVFEQPRPLLRYLAPQ